MESFIKVFKWVLERQDLSNSEKIMFSLLQALSEKKGFCICGNNYLKDKLNINVRQTQQILNNLEKKGFIFRENIKGKRHIIPAEKYMIPAMQ